MYPIVTNQRSFPFAVQSSRLRFICDDGASPVDTVVYMLTLGSGHTGTWSLVPPSSPSVPRNRFFHIACAYVRAAVTPSHEVLLASGGEYCDSGRDCMPRVLANAFSSSGHLPGVWIGTV